MLEEAHAIVTQFYILQQHFWIYSLLYFLKFPFYHQQSKPIIHTELMKKIVRIENGESSKSIPSSTSQQNAAAAAVSLEQASQYKIIKYRHCTVVDGPRS